MVKLTSHGYIFHFVIFYGQDNKPILTKCALSSLPLIENVQVNNSFTIHCLCKQIILLVSVCYFVCSVSKTSMPSFYNSDILHTYMYTVSASICTQRLCFPDGKINV